MKRRAAIVCLSAMAGVIGLIAIRKEPLRRAYYQRLRGAEPLAVKIWRTEQLKEIWEGLCQFKAIRGEFPISLEEWETVNPGVNALLREPRYSRHGNYRVAFDALRSPDAVLVVEDPGIYWPGDPERGFDEFRVALRSDGAIVGYSADPPVVYREATRCAGR